MKRYKINNKNLWDEIYTDFNETGGVYKVIWLKGTTPVTIPRLLKKDEQGVLYIGKAQSFLNRVIDLKKSILSNYKSDNHDFGKRYNKYAILKENILIDELFVELIFSDIPKITEAEELDKYYQKFGELPPFNFQS